MLCTMCMHGSSGDRYWDHCQDRHCPHILECPGCGIRKRDAQKYPTGWISHEIGPRLIGGMYHDGDRNDVYTVEDLVIEPDASNWGIRVRWSDGHRTVHSTAWDKRRDYVIRQPEASV